MRFDLSSVLWIVTAPDPKAIPEQMRTRLKVIELSGYTEQEKLHIAEQHLLKRPFEVTVPVSAGCLAPEPAASSSSVAPETGVAGPVVVAEREVSSMAELDALSARPPFPAADAWRTAASEGAVRRKPRRPSTHSRAPVRPEARADGVDGRRRGDGRPQPVAAGADAPTSFLGRDHRSVHGRCPLRAKKTHANLHTGLFGYLED